MTSRLFCPTCLLCDRRICTTFSVRSYDKKLFGKGEQMKFHVCFNAHVDRITCVMPAVHAAIMVWNCVEVVDVLTIWSVVFFRPRNIWQHVHACQREVNVDRLLAECWVCVRIGIKSLQMDHQHRWQLWNIKLFDGFTGFLAVWTVPPTHHLTVEIHVEALRDMALVDVVGRQLQTEVGEGFVRCTFVCAHGALYGAFNLPIKKPENKAFAGFCIFQPSFFRRRQRINRRLLDRNENKS